MTDDPRDGATTDADLIDRCTEVMKAAGTHLIPHMERLVALSKRFRDARHTESYRLTKTEARIVASALLLADASLLRAAASNAVFMQECEAIAKTPNPLLEELTWKPAE